MTALTNVRKIKSYAVVIRAIHERGQAQRRSWFRLNQRDSKGLDDPGRPG